MKTTSRRRVGIKKQQLQKPKNKKNMAYKKSSKSYRKSGRKVKYYTVSRGGIRL